MGEGGLGLGFQFRNDALCQNLSEFDTPLVEGINIPHNPLREYGMLIKRDQLTQRLWCQALRKDGVGWPVTFKHAMRHEPGRRTVRLHLRRRLAKSESFCLRENIREQKIMMAAQRI